MAVDRRRFLKNGLLAGGSLITSPWVFSTGARAAGEVKVGVLFSLTGGLSIIEKSLHDATMMAISEINAAGGVKGMKIAAIAEDGASDPKTYNEKASKLVIQDKVPKILITTTGAEWIADQCLALGHSEWGSMLNTIKGSGCDVVLSNVVGDSVVAFYREYKNQGLTHDKLPICATVTSEIEIAAMGAEYAVGSYTSFPYFQAIDTDRNKAFVERYRAFVKDPKAVTHHALESSYFQVFLWKQAAEKAAEITPVAIREAVKGQEFDAPNGHVKIDPENLHTYLTPRIAQWLPDGQGKIIDAYKEPTIPLPYVAYGETPTNLFCTGKGLETAKLNKT